MTGTGSRSTLRAMRKERLYYLENLKVALTVLVILQHALRAYGSVVWWFVKDGQAPLLERFAAVNSSFFMSLFFAMSFYFMGPSYDGKYFWHFHRDRIFRLFVPLVAYTALVSSTMMYLYFVRFRAYGTRGFLEYFRDFFLGMAPKPADWNGPSWPDLNLGHLWFVEHLLLYGLIYSLFRVFVKKRNALRPEEKYIPQNANEGASEIPFPSIAKIILFMLSLSTVTFAVRLRFPVYVWTGLFGFIQIEPAHFPFYLSMFFIGIVAYRNEWLAQMSGKTANASLVIGLASAAIIAALPVDARSFGGLSLFSLIYAFAETGACIGLVIGLPYLFWRRFNAQNFFMKALSQNTYMVYIIHLPIVALCQYALLDIPVNPYLKFSIVSAVAIPASFCASVLIRKIPYAKKYL